MKKIVIAVSVVAVLFAAGNLRAAKQRIPIAISGSALSAAGKAKLTSVDFLSSPSNRLVMAIDLAANTIEIEEWDAALANPIDRQPNVGGTQAVLLASFRMAKVINGTSFDFASDLETGDPVDSDWDNDGSQDTDGDISIIGRGSVSGSNTVTTISGKLQGLLNDSLHGATGGVDRILQKGKLKATDPAF